jgi:hypothetical protein
LTREQFDTLIAYTVGESKASANAVEALTSIVKSELQHSN